MKYLIMIMMNPEASAVWEKMGHDEQVEGYEAHNRVREAMDAAGELVAAEALQGQDVARRVRLRDGQVVTTDGPFAEVKEHLAGYYLVDCASIEKAVEWASRMPEAEFVDIEVRPVLDLHAVVAAGPDT